MTTTTPSTPGIARAVELDAQMRTLRAEQEQLLASIISAAEFMDVPIRELSELAEYSDSPLGAVWHVMLQSWEADPHWSKVYGHPAENCDHLWCQDVGVPQRAAKYQRSGDRWWHTYLGEHLLVGRSSDRYPTLTAIPLEVKRERS